MMPIHPADLPDCYLDPLASPGVKSTDTGARIAAQMELLAWCIYAADEAFARFSEPEEIAKACTAVFDSYAEDLDRIVAAHKEEHLERAADRLAERLSEVAYQYPPLPEEISFAGPDDEGVYRYEYRFSMEVSTYVDADSDDPGFDRIPVLDPDPPLKPYDPRATEDAA